MEKNNNNNSSNSLVIGRWPQTKSLYHKNMRSSPDLILFPASKFEGSSADPASFKDPTTSRTPRY